jgi:hypothetical protein
MSCTICAHPLSSRNRTGLCKAHVATRWTKPREEKRCTVCDAPISHGNTSGYCRKHAVHAAMRDPAYREKQRAGIRRKLDGDPTYLADVRRRAANLARDPDIIVRRTRYFRENEVWRIGQAAQPAGSEARRKAARSLRATRLAWCPEDLRQDYVDLIKLKGFKAAEARRMIEDQHEVAMQRWRRANGLDAAVAAKTEPDHAARASLAAKLVELRPVPRTGWRATVEAVAEAFKLTADDLLGASRNAQIIPARRTAMMIFRRRGFSYPQIGQWMNRDHSTVIAGCEAFEAGASPLMVRVAEFYAPSEAEAA